jgi:hypothetical protein
MNVEAGLSLNFICSVEERKKNVLSKDELATLSTDTNPPPSTWALRKRNIFFVIFHLYAVTVKQAVDFISSCFVTNIRVLKGISWNLTGVPVHHFS